MSRLQQEEQISHVLCCGCSPEKQHEQEEEVAQQQTVCYWRNYGTGKVGTLVFFSSVNNIFFKVKAPFVFGSDAAATLWTFVRAPCKKGRERMVHGRIKIM